MFRRAKITLVPERASITSLFNDIDFDFIDKVANQNIYQ